MTKLHPTGKKPFVPKAPPTEENQKQEGPNPDSDPNYSYYPNVAYPTGMREEEEQTDTEDTEDISK